ncbi:hypothetical protein lerEdw1_004524 [Lerista edwardsae]|nr:hypothetical protein lerEdw1_004524 [Lerista edwardsae]
MAQPGGARGRVAQRSSRARCPGLTPPPGPSSPLLVRLPEDVLLQATMAGCAVRLLLLLLGLLVGPGGAGRGAESPEQEAAAAGQAAGGEEELREEDGVLVLTQRSFARALRRHRLLLVAFCDPLAGHWQALAPEYAKAAALLRNDSSGPRLAKVDAAAEEALRREFGVGREPVLKLFRDGNRTHPTDCAGPQDADDLVKWLRRKAGPSAVLLAGEAGAAAFLEAHAVAVVGFFHRHMPWAAPVAGVATLPSPLRSLQDLRGEAARRFSEVASEALEVAFALTDSARLFRAFDVSRDTVALFRQEEPRADFLVDPDLGLDAAELARFITVQSLAPVMEFTRKNASRIFGAKIPHHLLLFVNKTEARQLELLGPFRAAAAPLRGQVSLPGPHSTRPAGAACSRALLRGWRPWGRALRQARLSRPVGAVSRQVLFVLVDVGGEGAPLLLYFGLRGSDTPALRFVTIETNAKYRLAPEGLTAAAISAFCLDVLGGRIQPHLSSQEMPEDWDKRPVKTLVGRNFEEVAFDEAKSVFVKFYAPWCPHSQAMAGVWEELGEKFQDHPDILIAEMDATANEVAALPIRAYPSLYYFPAGPGREASWRLVLLPRGWPSAWGGGREGLMQGQANASLCPQVREYRSTRDLDSFSAFLESGGVLPPAEESAEQRWAKTRTWAAALQFLCSHSALASQAAETLAQETGSTSPPETVESRDEL